LPAYSIISHLYRDDLRNRLNVRRCIHPSVRCQYCQNPKTLTLLGWQWWILACIFFILLV